MSQTAAKNLPDILRGDLADHGRFSQLGREDKTDPAGDTLFVPAHTPHQKTEIPAPGVSFRAKFLDQPQGANQRQLAVDNPRRDRGKARIFFPQPLGQAQGVDHPQGHRLAVQQGIKIIGRLVGVRESMPLVQKRPQAERIELVPGDDPAFDPAAGGDDIGQDLGIMPVERFASFFQAGEEVLVESRGVFDDLP